MYLTNGYKDMSNVDLANAFEARGMRSDSFFGLQCPCAATYEKRSLKDAFLWE